MKKVLSVAMASAMVLGMGANAFAIQYNTSSSDTAAWPTNFQFDGELFVTDKDGNIVKEASTLLNDQEAVNFQPGDVIWMPLYADNQLSYSAQYEEGTTGEESITSLRLNLDNKNFRTEKKMLGLYAKDGKWYRNETEANDISKAPLTEQEIAEYNKGKGTNVPVNSKAYEQGKLHIFEGTVLVYAYIGDKYDEAGKTVEFNGLDREVQKGSLKLYINGTRYTDVDKFNADVVKKDYTDKDVYATVDLVKKAGTDDVVGKPSVDAENGVRAYGLYTGNIDKNWSINLIEKDGTVSDLIAKAELYKATATDYASYEKYTDQIMPNAVYLKVTLKKEWKTVSNETLKYYVYVANNKNNQKTTNKVWVSGKYAPSYRTVDFTWTNNANVASLWKAEENGVAVFDFADKAFFTVKMYKGETMYLDLSTAYDKAIAGDMGVDADSFYKFDNTNANFARAGELVIVTNDDTLVPYEIDEDGNFVELDADYVTNYAIAHTNQKVNGFRFDTKQLGNYVLSTEELGAEEEPEEPAKEPSEEPAPEVKPENNGKQNPNTGAEDFVGLAVSLAVVSVAAAGALALKK